MVSRECQVYHSLLFVSRIYIIGESLEQQRSNAHSNSTKTHLALRARTQVQKDKVEQTREYLEKAIKRFDWNVPILGVVPDGELLDRPCAADLGTLFGTSLRGNPTHAYRTIDKFELVTTSLEKFMEKLERMMTHQGKINNTAFVTHRSRADIVRSVRARSARISIISLFHVSTTHSNYKNMPRIAHPYRKKITRKSSLECKIYHDENLTRASRSNTGTRSARICFEKR